MTKHKVGKHGLASALILSGLALISACKAPDAPVDVVDGKTEITRTGSESLPSSNACPAVPKEMAIGPLPGTGPDGRFPPDSEYNLKLLQTVMPHYPACASLRRVGGVVDVEYTVRPDGSVKEARILQEVPAGFGFSEAFLTAFFRWRFQPKIVDGQPVETKGYYRFRAKIN